VDGLDIPLNHILFISSLLFAIGMLGLMIRRNIIFILMSL
jgi:NADH-quinone oxidoreductase subunit K